MTIRKASSFLNWNVLYQIPLSLNSFCTTRDILPSSTVNLHEDLPVVLRRKPVVTGDSDAISCLKSMTPLNKKGGGRGSRFLFLVWPDALAEDSEQWLAWDNSDKSVSPVEFIAFSLSGKRAKLLFVSKYDDFSLLEGGESKFTLKTEAWACFWSWSGLRSADLRVLSLDWSRLLLFLR